MTGWGCEFREPSGREGGGDVGCALQPAWGEGLGGFNTHSNNVNGKRR